MTLMISHKNANLANLVSLLEISLFIIHMLVSLAQLVKNRPAIQETWV